ncbi:MAG: glycoside hydrolase family 2 TIM barrel-domain containing protein [Oscillospiraceae bacterium]
MFNFFKKEKSLITNEKKQNRKLIGGEAITYNLNNNWEYEREKLSPVFVNLPHNTTLYSDDNKNGYIGVSTYKRIINLKSDCKGKRIVLKFGGVMQKCEIYLNSLKIFEHTNGNLPFTFDISDVVKFDFDNVLLVKCDSSPCADFTPGKQNPDFQYFGGIHRNVTLEITDNIYITDSVEANIAGGGGIFLRSSDVSSKMANILAKVYIENACDESYDIKLKSYLCYKDEQIETKEKTITLAKSSIKVADLEFKIENPLLWHPNHPDLYTLKFEISYNDEIKDTKTINYGIRKIEWKHTGLYINDEKFIAQGVNLHSDIFAIGNAIPDNVVFEEIRDLKECGFDFIRMAHYPHSKAYYDAADKYGVLILNCMSGWQNFNNTKPFRESTYEELRIMIRSMRNHPSIVAWETSLNESNYTTSWAKEVQRIAQAEYPKIGVSRIFTTGWKTNCFDIALGASQHNVRADGDKTDKGVIISECGDWDYGGTSSTSRKARELGDRDMLIQASNHIETELKSRAKSWFSADALWTYSDYAGFDDGMNYCGVVDMYRIRKHSAYFFKSQRDASINLSNYGVLNGPFVYIANSWNVNSPLKITAFSNCEYIELFLNDRLIGKRYPDEECYCPNENKMLSSNSLPHPPTTFNIDKFESGTLKAIGYINEKAVSEHIIKTSDSAVSLLIEADERNVVSANASDLNRLLISAYDENLVADTSSSATINITVQNGVVIGENPIRLRGGKVATFIRPDFSKDDLDVTVKVTSSELKGFEYQFTAKCATGNYLENATKNQNEYAFYQKTEKLFEDVAREKLAVASSCGDGCTPQMGNNGEPSTFFMTGDKETFWYVDTGKTSNIDRVEISWNENEKHCFIIDVSDDAKTWCVANDKSSGEIDIQSVCKIEKNARYVRIRIDSKKSQGFNMFYAYSKLGV